MITVYYRARLEELTQKKSETLEAATVKDVFTHIRQNYGRQAYKEANQMLVTVGGMSICLEQNKRTLLADGAEVKFFPICGGG